MITPMNVLDIDLSNKRYHVYEREELFKRYLGGTGVAINLLSDNCPKGTDPLGPDNPIIFSVGPLNGLFPLVSKTVSMFKSPHTGNLGESHAGGRSSIAIRTAGYGAIVIKGCSNTPIFLSIDKNGVEFRDASALWGIQNALTVGRIARELDGKSGLRTIMRIGGAGENLVRYACVMTETYRHFGRLGLGAVFGSKKLKAIIITGDRSIEVSNKREYRRLYDEIYNKIVNSSLMKKYHELGTAANVMPLNKIGGLPIKNLGQVTSPDVANISGENLTKGFLGRRAACAHCPVACIHVAALREPYETEPFFYQTKMVPYDYETVYSLGSMLGVFDVKNYLRLMDTVETFSLDAMSVGVILAWATEAFKKGLISTKETLGLEFNWGDADTYSKAVEFISKGKNDFYISLGRGVEYSSAVYGGQDYALAFGSNEMPGYHTGPLGYIGFLTGGRHSHLDNAGYSFDQKYSSKDELPEPDEAANMLYSEETWRQVLNSLVVCLFSRKVYNMEIVMRALKICGIEFDENGLKECGKEISREKYLFKVREGFDPNKLRVPERIFETVSPLGKIEKDYLMDTVDEIYRKYSK